MEVHFANQGSKDPAEYEAINAPGTSPTKRDEMNGLDPIRHSRTDGEPGHWHGAGPPAPGREPRIARPSGWPSCNGYTAAV